MKDSYSEVVAEIRSLKERLYTLETNLRGFGVEEDLPDGELTFLIAWVGEDPMAVPAGDIVEVVPMPTLTPMPEAPPWLAGLLDLGGDVIPVIDVLARVRRTRREYRPGDFTVLVRVDKTSYGLVVQGIDRIQTADRDALVPPPKEVPAAPYLMGAVVQEEGSVLLLSVRKLIALSDIPERR